MSEQPDRLSAEESEKSGIERRASTRYPCNLATSCRLAASVKGTAYTARVRNISAGGVSLVLNHEFVSGELVALDLRSTTRNFARTLQVRVIYCIEHPSGDWILGGAFVEPLADDEVKAFLT
ncbi:MAG: PilZ domain-containing protein [Gemmataceae bacterium]|nr:PilZ domain-containing protein [Gemmataceae bacterium]